jgi:hypothetical protein
VTFSLLYTLYRKEYSSSGPMETYIQTDTAQLPSGTFFTSVATIKERGIVHNARVKVPLLLIKHSLAHVSCTESNFSNSSLGQQLNVLCINLRYV